MGRRHRIPTDVVVSVTFEQLVAEQRALDLESYRDWVRVREGQMSEAELVMAEAGRRMLLQRVSHLARKVTGQV